MSSSSVVLALLVETIVDDDYCTARIIASSAVRSSSIRIRHSRTTYQWFTQHGHTARGLSSAVQPLTQTGATRMLSVVAD